LGLVAPPGSSWQETGPIFLGPRALSGWGFGTAQLASKMPAGMVDSKKKLRRLDFDGGVVVFILQIVQT
jgi:hypothetical protein